MNTLLAAATELHNAGFSVVPVAADGTKRPRIAWKQYTAAPAPIEQLTEWFTDTTPQGIGVITGVNQLELLELEGKAMTHVGDVIALIDGSGLTPLYQRILHGWSEQSPSGGLHFLYRISDTDVPGNTKIAQAPADTTNGRDTLAETRGTGGFVVTAPSAGTVHATGKPYLRLSGGPATVATISRAERDDLHAVIHAALDSMPEVDAALVDLNPIWETTSHHAEGDVTPGDDYETRTDWAEILKDWTHVFTRGTTRYWRRPGKKEGISATTGRADDRDRLYVFTSSTAFEPETPYTKFGAYALLEHRSDHQAAAKHLAANGYGYRAPRTLTPASNTGSTTTPNTATDATAPIIDSDAATLTDDGNARLLATAYAAKLKYIPDSGRWATWNGNRWTIHPDDAPAIAAARDVIRRLPTDNKQIATWRQKSLSARAITGVVRLARADEHMRVLADQFDRHGWELNTPNGVVNLRTGDTKPPLPTLWHSKQTKVTPDPDQPTPLWNQFLQTTFQNNTPMVNYLQRLVGMSMIGEVIEHVLPFFHGGGGNGKTVFLETITSILGDYATEAPHGFLLAGRDKHETELAKLQGARLVVASEINENTRFDEAKVKALTGGDKITARFMRQDFFTFPPTHTLWLMGNNQPNVETGGHSFWRRLRLIPFTHTVAPEQIIEQLQQRLVDEEGAGILHWMIRGAVDYARDGLNTPAEVIAATHAYQQEEDALGRFIEERCIIGGGEHARTLASDLRRAYDTWCQTDGTHELNVTAFGRQLKQKFDINAIRSNGRRYYTNVLLAGDESTASESTDGTQQGLWWDK